MVRAFAHGAMGHLNDPSWWTIELFLIPAMGARGSSVDRAFAHGAMGRQIDPSRYCPVCGVVHIKDPLLLIGKSSPCGNSGFPLSLSEWSFTICLTPYNH